MTKQEIIAALKDTCVLMDKRKAQFELMIHSLEGEGVDKAENDNEDSKGGSDSSSGTAEWCFYFVGYALNFCALVCVPILMCNILIFFWSPALSCFVWHILWLKMGRKIDVSLLILPFCICALHVSIICLFVYAWLLIIHIICCCIFVATISGLCVDVGFHVATSWWFDRSSCYSENLFSVIFVCTCSLLTFSDMLEHVYEDWCRC